MEAITGFITAPIFTTSTGRWGKTACETISGRGIISMGLRKGGRRAYNPQFDRSKGRELSIGKGNAGDAGDAGSGVDESHLSENGVDEAHVPGNGVDEVHVAGNGVDEVFGTGNGVGDLYAVGNEAGEELRFEGNILDSLDEDVMYIELVDDMGDDEELEGNDGGRDGGNGSDEDGREWEEGDSDGDAEEVHDQVAALLKKANRPFDTLPSDVRLGNADQISRFLQVEQMPLLGLISKSWPGFRDRLVANGRFPLQLGTELCVGFVTKTLAEVKGRGEKFWKEFDFYLSDLALELVGDAMLVWLLSPVAVWGVGKKGFLGRLPKHIGEIGGYGIGERVGGFIWKGMLFGGVGFVSSVVGHGATRAMVKGRNGGNEEGVELAGVWENSVAWGCFMGSSSNARYQLVNTFEQRVLEPVLGAHGVVLGVVTLGLRFANCFEGGRQWLPFAKRFGVQ